MHVSNFTHLDKPRGLAVAVAFFFFLTFGAVSAQAVGTFTETFDSNVANWLDGDSGTPTYHASGGVGDSGHISYAVPAFNSGAGGFGDPLRLLFRGNASADASGDAFVGDWLTDGVESLSLSIRHNYDSDLSLYMRIAGFGGAGASLANDPLYTIAPDVWTTITIPIIESNPPFTSYGSSSFAGVFSNVQNLQVGLYLPANTDFDGLVVGLDDVGVTVVPEPSTAVLLGLGLASFAARRRR